MSFFDMTESLFLDGEFNPSKIAIAIGAIATTMKVVKTVNKELPKVMEVVNTINQLTELRKAQFEGFEESWDE